MVTTEQAAAMTGRRPATVRQWVKRGYLKPALTVTDDAALTRHRYHEADVWRCDLERMSRGEREALLAKAAILRGPLAEPADEVSRCAPMVDHHARTEP